MNTTRQSTRWYYNTRLYMLLLLVVFLSEVLFVSSSSSSTTTTKTLSLFSSSSNSGNVGLPSSQDERSLTFSLRGSQNRDDDNDKNGLIRGRGRRRQNTRAFCREAARFQRSSDSYETIYVGPIVSFFYRNFKRNSVHEGPCSTICADVLCRHQPCYNDYTSTTTTVDNDNDDNTADTCTCHGQDQYTYQCGDANTQCMTETDTCQCKEGFFGDPYVQCKSANYDVDDDDDDAFGVKSSPTPAPMALLEIIAAPLRPEDIQPPQTAVSLANPDYWEQFTTTTATTTTSTTTTSDETKSSSSPSSSSSSSFHPPSLYWRPVVETEETTAEGPSNNNVFGAIPYSYNPATGTWSPESVQLPPASDCNDEKDNTLNIDDCIYYDVNQDGTANDLICLRRRQRQQQKHSDEENEENEEGETHVDIFLHKTAKDGTTRLEKVQAPGHGLNKYTYKRRTKSVVLKGPNKSQFIFMATDATTLSSGQSNQHTMYEWTSKKHTSQNSCTGVAEEIPFFFREVHGPWKNTPTVNAADPCLIVHDINQDGLDDLFLCNTAAAATGTAAGAATAPIMYIQEYNAHTGTTQWRTIAGGSQHSFANARIADVTGDGIPDLIAITSTATTTTTTTTHLQQQQQQPQQQQQQQLQIYAGLRTFPYFASNLWLNRPWFQLDLPYTSPDLEILDANQDGRKDIYVIQTDTQSPTSPCAVQSNQNNNNNNNINNNNDPIEATTAETTTTTTDLANDLLLYNNVPHSGYFQVLELDHSNHNNNDAFPTCPERVESFGNNDDDSTLLLLKQGTQDTANHVLLSW